MKKTTTKEKRTFVPKTVKTATIVKGFLVVIALVASFVAGWHTNQNYQFNVREQASALVTELASKDQK